MTIDQVLQDLPDSMIRAAACGLPRYWQAVMLPEDLKPINCQVILLGKPGDDFIPPKCAMFTTKQRAAQVEQEHDVQRAFTFMTEAEKIAQLGETDPSLPTGDIRRFYSR